MTPAIPKLSRALAAAIVSILALLASEGPASAQDQKPVQLTPPATSAPVDPFLLDLQERTFKFFWDTANPANGLVPDRYPSPSFSSIAAVGFGLTTYPVGVERGYITRAQARQRVLATLRFLSGARQGPQARNFRVQGLMDALGKAQPVERGRQDPAAVLVTR